MTERPFYQRDKFSIRRTSPSTLLSEFEAIGGSSSLELKREDGMVVRGYDLGDLPQERAVELATFATSTDLRVYIVGDLLVTATEPSPFSPEEIQKGEIHTREHYLDRFINSIGTPDIPLSRTDGTDVYGYDWSLRPQGERIRIATNAVAAGLHVSGSDAMVIVRGRIAKLSERERPSSAV